jgi:Rad3-related DNA helicase
MDSAASESVMPLGEQVERDLREGGLLSEALPGYEERPAQIEMARRVAQALETGEHLVLEAPTGVGKALDVETPIPTPDGWKRMGDLVVGDTVFDETGQPTRVVTAFDIMHDRPCYEVVFSDGSTLIADAEHQWASYTCTDREWAGRTRSAVYAAKKFVTPEKLALIDQLIAASEDTETLSMAGTTKLLDGHQWSVFQSAKLMTPANPGARSVHYPRQALLTAVRGRLARDLSEQSRGGRSYTIVTTEQMAATLTTHTAGRANHAIPVSGALSLPEVDLPIHPYFLGVWLGDGSSYSNQITTADPDLIPIIECLGYIVRPIKSHPYQYAVDDENGKAVSRWQPGMTGRLRTLGVRLNKHIPAIYLRASEEQRRALLAGLLDTDGTVNRTGAVQFTTTKSQLAEDVSELLCSLGFRPSVIIGRARLNGKDCGPKWTLGFTTDQQVFQLPRKAAAHKERLRNYTPERNRFRYVTDVRQVDSRPVRCIQVESASHLYLAGRAMIPTHNSIAYLLPIVRSGKVALVSTANKALQEQLFYKDIPFIQQHIEPFPAALVKGMGNYLCLDLLEEERAFQQYTRQTAFAKMEELLGDYGRWDGDLDLLPMALASDTRSRVAADNERCAWRACAFYQDCYVREMREAARQARVIVVNHTLLLLDAAMGGWLLPERDLIVIDEAHHLEEEATRAFTITVTPGRVRSLLAQQRLQQNSDPAVQQRVMETSAEAWDALARAGRPDALGRQRLTQPIEEGLRLSGALTDLAESLQAKRPLTLDEKEDLLYDKLVKRTRVLAADTRIVFGQEAKEERVYYAEQSASRRGRSSQPAQSISAAPLEVTELLREKLFDRIPIIATSATLAVGGDFSFFRSRVGLVGAQEATLPYAFDYRNNALLYVPRMRNEPAYGAAGTVYLDELAEQMAQLIEASHGRAFLLFSSQRALQHALKKLEDSPAGSQFTFLVQGEGLSRVELTRQFRQRDRAVLFGLKSFWEGVDVVGEALSLVVIDKLPFDPPDDPVNEARVNAMKQAGENWFGGYALPMAILRLKQGIGRLLRTKDDRGVMAILDKRLYTKSYGAETLRALPPATRTADIAEVNRFFAE